MLARDPDPDLAHPEAAGCVLGVLDGFDADRFGGHLQSCPDCQAAVAELGPAARLLQPLRPPRRHRPACRPGPWPQWRKPPRPPGRPKDAAGGEAGTSGCWR